MIELRKKLEELGFKFNNNFTSSASYIMQDGMFLNINEQNNLNLRSNIFHGQLDDYIRFHNLMNLEDKIFVDDKQKEYMKNCRNYFIADSNYRYLKYSDNAIVVNGGTGWWENCYVDLPDKPLTSKQFEALTLWLDTNAYQNNKRRIAISLNEKFVEYDSSDLNVDDIIKYIKRLYNELCAEK